MRDDEILKTNNEEIAKLVNESYSFIEVMDKLGFGNNSNSKIYYRIKRYVNKLNINYDHFTKNNEQSNIRWSKENLLKCINNSMTYKEIIEKLDLIPTSSSYTTLKKYLLKYDIKFKPTNISEKWRKENLEKIIRKCNSLKECLILMGIRAAGDNYKQITNYINKYGIDISHFNNKRESFKYGDEEVFVENSKYSRTNLKKRLYDSGLKDRKCELCGQDENWMGKKISLILDHINGVYNDNRLENLRIVCPNCNSTLETHAGKNKTKKTKKLYLCKCGKEKSNKSNKCIDCSSKEKRKIERPPYYQLLKEIEELGYSGTGRKYGVSDNSIRKWVKNYEKELKIN